MHTYTHIHKHKERGKQQQGNKAGAPIGNRVKAFETAAIEDDGGTDGNQWRAFRHNIT